MSSRPRSWSPARPGSPAATCSTCCSRATDARGRAGGGRASAPTCRRDTPGRVARNRAARSRRRCGTRSASLAPDVLYHLAGAPHVGQSWGTSTDTLAINVLATHHLLEALRLAGLRRRASSIPSSAYVYRPADRALSEDDPLEPSQSVRHQQDRHGAGRPRGPRSRRHPGRGRPIVQSHRPAAGPVVLRVGVARQIAQIEAGLLRAGASGRQPRRPARLHRRARHGAGLWRAGGARRARTDLQRVLRVRRASCVSCSTALIGSRAVASHREAGPRIGSGRTTRRCCSAIRPGSPPRSAGSRRFHSNRRCRICSTTGVRACEAARASPRHRRHRLSRTGHRRGSPAVRTFRGGLRPIGVHQRPAGDHH